MRDIAFKLNADPRPSAALLWSYASGQGSAPFCITNQWRKHFFTLPATSATVTPAALHFSACEHFCSFCWRVRFAKLSINRIVRPFFLPFLFSFCCTFFCEPWNHRIQPILSEPKPNRIQYNRRSYNVATACGMWLLWARAASRQSQRASCADVACKSPGVRSVAMLFFALWLRFPRYDICTPLLPLLLLAALATKRSNTEKKRQGEKCRNGAKNWPTSAVDL